MKNPASPAFAFGVLLFLIYCISHSHALNEDKRASDSTTDIAEPSLHQLRALLELDDAVNTRRRKPRPPKRSPPPARRSPPPKRTSLPPPRRSPRPPPKSPSLSPSLIPSPSPIDPPPSPIDPPPSPIPSPPTNACSTITFDSVTITSTFCIEMKDQGNRPIGTAGFSLSPQNVLTIAFKAASGTPGWLSFGYNSNGGAMVGTSAVFAQSCGGTSCAQGYSKQLNGYVYQSFGPSQVEYSDILAGKDGGVLLGSAKMTWPTGKESLSVMLASGPVGGGNPQIHFGVPQVVSLKKSDLV